MDLPENGDICTAEPVDGLLEISNSKQTLPIAAHDSVDDCLLNLIGILCFIEKDVPEARCVLCSHICIIQQTKRETLQVVEIEQRLLRLHPFVIPPNRACMGVDANLQWRNVVALDLFLNRTVNPNQGLESVSHYVGRCLDLRTYAQVLDPSGKTGQAKKLGRPRLVELTKRRQLTQHLAEPAVLLGLLWSADGRSCDRV